PAYTYIFSPAGPTVGAGGEITGFTTGVTYTVTATSGDECVSPASAEFTIVITSYSIHYTKLYEDRNS
uniref:hypothetical protein n=1 Tax=Litoribacter populi TaxID=2598460 RepID=UPI001C8F57FD